MTVVRRLFLVILLGVLPMGASAFEAPDLEAASAAYLDGLQKRHVGEEQKPAEALSLAMSMAGIGEWQTAVEQYQRVVAAEPENVTAWLGLATAWLNHDGGQPETAQAAYRAYLTAATDPARADALTVLGAAFERRTQFLEAIRAYRAALDLGARTGTGIREHLANLVEQHGFTATGVEVAADSDRPEFCIVFRRNLSTDPAVRFDDYLRIDPPVGGAATVRDDRLCVDGVDHGGRYDVTVLAGLPSADGDVTARAEIFDVEIGDRPASVGFRGNTYVLPRTGGTGIPVITVNLDRVRLKVLRIDERNLVRQLNQGRVPNLLGSWDIGQVTEQEGETVWEGEMDVALEKNQRVTTAFPVGDILAHTQPGIYAAIAEPVESDGPKWGLKATQWLVVSDLGLTTFAGDDGLNVFVRSLESAKARSGVTVQLLARNNSVLAEARTDVGGGARFDPGLLKGDGGREPKALFLFTGDGDFNFLDLAVPAFDLSDRGVGGRETPGAIDAFLYADRGVYRRGETAHVTALLRDGAAMAVDGLPLTLRLLRPDGVEASRRVVSPEGIGAYAVDLPFATGVQTGRWTLAAHLDPEAAPVGRLRLLVEDVVPPRIEVKMATDAEALVPGEAAELNVEAGYLYGAPAGDLPAEGEVVVLRDEAPYPQWPGYSFGLAGEEVAPQRTALPVERTDADGVLAVSLLLDSVPDVTQPLKAVVRTGVFELGGRPATASLTLPVRARDTAIGLRSRFAGGGVPEGGEAGFDVLVLDGEGNPAASELEYRFVREDWVYRWFRTNGAWDYTVQIVDKPLGGGKLAVTDSGLAQLAQTVDWGRYRLEVFDPQTGAASSLRFRSGWFMAPTAADRPDTLEVTVDKQSYQPGETAKIHIRPPFDAEVLLAIANDRVLETRSLSVPRDGATVEIPFSSDWGVGAYVLATAFRPDSKQRGPGRAIGLAWLGLDAAPRTLEIVLDAPEGIRPRQAIEIPVEVSGIEPGKPAYVTLAAVDEGVLQLTGFETPDPAGHFYGKRRLGVALRDLYGRLIDGKGVRRGAVRTGGGDPRLADKGAPPVDVKIVALFSGLVALDAQGRARVPLDIPDFNGRLRLMAVAFDARRVGAGEAALTVRDPLIAQASFPRFLAPGDTSRLTLVLRNLDAPAGDVTARLRAEGAVTLTGGGEATASLDPGRSGVVVFGLKGTGAGAGKLVLDIEGPGGFALSRDWSLAVRPARFPITERLARRLQPGETVDYSQAMLAKFVPGTGEVLLSFSPRPSLDVPGLLRALDRYPYGCLEQTTSRALPLLYVGGVAELWGDGSDGGAPPVRIRQAISRILGMQRPDGGFALWNPAGDAEMWLSAYAMDFLIRAKAAGFNVPARAYGAGLKWLEKRVQQMEWSDKPDLAATAYALYDLAAAGVGEAAPVRYFADQNIDKLPTPIAAAQLAAALALHGEVDRARTYFGKALDRLGQRPDLRDYGSSLRDLAALVTLAADSDDLIGGVARDWGGRDLAALVEDLAVRQSEAEYMSPQEQAWLILAATALGGDTGGMTLTVGGAAGDERTQPLYLRPDEAQLATGLSYGNGGGAAVWHTATVSGVPVNDPPARSDGFALSRGFYTLDGEPADLSSVEQNDVLVVVIEGEATGDLDHQALVVDLLPAGLEIENARLDDARSARELSWLPKLSKTEHVEYRDDRFVAALDIEGEKREFAVAYLARAVTPGDYRLPASHVEDMYKPNFRAWTEPGLLKVLPAN